MGGKVLDEAYVRPTRLPRRRYVGAVEETEAMREAARAELAAAQARTRRARMYLPLLRVTHLPLPPGVQEKAELALRGRRGSSSAVSALRLSRQLEEAKAIMARAARVRDPHSRCQSGRDREGAGRGGAILRSLHCAGARYGARALGEPGGRAGGSASGRRRAQARTQGAWSRTASARCGSCGRHRCSFRRSGECRCPCGRSCCFCCGH